MFNGTKESKICFNIMFQSLLKLNKRVYNFNVT